MKIGAIIQARTSSTRLPEKVLKKLPYNSDITVLEQVILRLKRSKMLNEIIVATTTDDNDSKIIDIADSVDVNSFMGSKNDVLERYYLAAKKYDLDVVVRITSDCPCVDPIIVDTIIEKFLKTDAEYASNTMTRSFPVGIDVEVLSFDALEKCYLNASNDLEHEHVTTYIHNNPDKFKTRNVTASVTFYGPQIRITLDTEEDYALLCSIFDYLYNNDKFFSTADIVQLFKAKPWLKLINKKIMAKKSFKTFEDEYNAALNLLKLQEFNRIEKFLEECHSQ